MGALTRDAILKADDLPRRKVAAPEWGGDIYVRAITGAERDAFDVWLSGQSGDQRKVTRAIRAKVAALTICDEKGAALFTDADIDALAKKSGKVLTRVLNVSEGLNALFGQAIEEIAGN